MHECGKATMRRMYDAAYANTFFVGNGIDIGAGPDGLSSYSALFPRMTGCRDWDLPDGDAQRLAGVKGESFDFVHSSHCLEHMRQPVEALHRWFEVLKPGGHLIVLIPDEDLYEQGVFPSTYNPDHKATFTIQKQRSWSPASINVLDLLISLGQAADIVRVLSLRHSFRPTTKRMDQTLTPVGECAIEFVVRKRTAKEMQHG